MNDAHKQFNIGRLLLIGNLSIFMIGLGFAVSTWAIPPPWWARRWVLPSPASP